MAIKVDLKLLNDFNSSIDEYHEQFCDYYLRIASLLTSLEVFQQSQRKVLKEISTIAVELHHFNHKLLIYIENLWSSLDWSKSYKSLKNQIKLLKFITKKFLKLNNKLNMMNKSIHKIWTYIYNVERDFRSFFKLNSLNFIIKFLVSKVKRIKKFIKRLLVDFKHSQIKKATSEEFQLIIIINMLNWLKL